VASASAGRIVLSYKKRFTREEESALYQEVLKHWYELFGDRRHAVPRGSRASVWNNIAATLGATFTSREGDDVRKKWNTLKNQLVAKLAVIEATNNADWGETPVPDLTDLEEEKIAAKMKLSVPGPGVISSIFFFSFHQGPGTSHGSVEGEDDDSDSSDREAAVPSPPETLQPEQAIPSPSAQLTPERVQAILDRQRENNRLLAQTLHIQQASLDIQRSCLEALKDVREVLSGLLAVQQARLEMDMGPSRSMAGTLPRPVLAVLTPPERSSSLSNHIHPDSSSHLSDTHNDPKSNPSANTDSVFHQTPVTCSLRVSLPYTLPQGFTSGANPPSPSWSDSMQHLSPDCPSGRDPPVPNNLPVSYRQGHGGGRRGRPPKTKIMTTSPKGSKKCKRT
uniref:Myb-like domain-containing protein n=1 Tax=Denticeps clupeoides TaxID=299321 RepID=A0AAY3ZZS0_9TELE